MKRNTVLLDAGGVLLDETEMEKRFCSLSVSLLKELVPEYTEELYWRDMDEAVQVFAPRTRPYIYWKYCNGNRQVYTRLLEEFKEIRKEFTGNIVLMDGIGRELKELAGTFKLVMAGQYGANVYTLLEEHGLAGLFVNRLSQEDYPITKPDPRYLERIARDAGVEPAQCIMVGDRIDNDVVPGKQNGMGTVFIRSGRYKNQQPRDALEVPDVVLESVKGLATAIQETWGR